MLGVCLLPLTEPPTIRFSTPNPMKLQYLLLFASSLLLLDVTPSFSAPTQLAAQYRESRESSNGFGSCQASKQAVVTVYAGREIGSGSIVNPTGLVITNYHVVNEVVGGNRGGQLSVRTSDGQRFSGKVIGTDRKYDLALIQLNAAEQFPTLSLASSDSIQMGQSVCAIGSPFGKPGVLTTGTLSKVRTNGDLQSNVVLNPGNSGGPLLNDRGEMIGVNKAILQSPSGRNTGISFATSIQAARSFIQQYSPGSVSTPIARRPATVPTPPIAIAPPAQPPTNTILPGAEMVFEPSVTPAPPVATPPTAHAPLPVMSLPPLGNSGSPSNQVVITTDPVTGTPPTTLVPPPQYPLPESTYPQPAQRPPSTNTRLGATVDVRNMVVRQVQSGSPAAMGGLQPGDRLIAINGNQLSQFEQLKAFLNRQPESAVFTVNRNRQVATVRVNF